MSSRRSSRHKRGMEKPRLFIDLPKMSAYNGPPLSHSYGGYNVRCPNGHYSCTVTRGYEPKEKDYYLEAWCSKCRVRQRIYDKERLQEHEPAI
jgi:hypothetical protein